jgi:hypothetical protein
VDINGVLKIVRENIQITARESLRILWIEEAWVMVWQGMLKIIRSKETNQITVVAGSKWNKWG